MSENILFDIIWGGPKHGMVITMESGGTSNKKPKKPKKDNLIKRIIKKLFKKNKNKNLGDKSKESKNHVSIQPVVKNPELEV